MGHLSDFAAHVVGMGAVVGKRGYGEATVGHLS